MYRVVSLILALAMVFSCAVFAAADDYDCETNGHEFTKMVVVDPTCEEDGYTTFECHVCGKENIELRTSYTDALGHDYIEQTTDPTCEEAGSVVFVCSRCGEVSEDSFESVPALGHTFVEETVSPTCTADGGIYNVCSVCDERILLEVLSATDHKNDLVVTSPTCKDEGYIYNVCSICGEKTLVEVLPVLSHTDISPTDGYCDLCGTQLVISPAKVQKEAEETPTDTTPTDIEETETPIKDKLQNFKSLFSAPLKMVAPPTNPAINEITLTDYVKVVSGTSISSGADVNEVKPTWSTITDDGFVVDLSKSYITTNENLSNLADVVSITNGVYYHIQGIKFTDTDDDLTVPNNFAGYTYLGTDTNNYFYYSISLGNVVGVGTFSTKNDFLKAISQSDIETKVYLGSTEKSVVTVSNSNLVTAEVYFTTSTSIDAPACDRISPDYSGNSYTYYEVIKFTGEEYDNTQWKFTSTNQTAYVDGTGFTCGGISSDGTSLFMYRELRTFSASQNGKVPFTDALRIKAFTGYNFVTETSGKITGIKDIETFTVCGGNYYLQSDYELKSNICFSEECTLDFNNNKIKTYIYDLKINSGAKVKFYNGSFSSGDQKTAESYKYNDGKSSGTFSFPSPRRGLINEGILTLENININSQEFSSHIIENSSGKVYLYNTEISGNTMTNDGNHYAINGGTTIISDEKVVINNNNFTVGNWPKPYNRNVNSTIIISSTNLHPETSVSIYTKDIKNFKLEVDQNAKVSPSNFKCDDDNYFLFVEIQGDKKVLKFIEDCTVSFSSPNVYKNEKLSSLIIKDYQLVTPGNYASNAPKMSNGSYWFDESGTYELIFTDVDSVFRIPALNGENIVTNCNVYAFYEGSSVRTITLDLNKIALPAENSTEKWSWEEIGGKRTLSLNGVDFQVNSDAAIILPSDNKPLDIIVSGTNKVVGGRFGIYCKETTETSTGENDLVTFKGNGRLESTASWMREFAPTKPIIGYNPNHYNMSDIHVSYKGLNNDVAYAYENWTVEDEGKILTSVTEWQPYYRKNNGEHLDHSYGNQHYIQYTSIYPTGIEYLDAAIGFRSDKELSVDSNSKLELVFTGDLAGAKFNTKNNRLADNSSVVVLGSAISNTNANRQSMTDLYGVNVAQPLDGDQAKARTIRFDGLTTEEHLDKLNGYDFESFRPYTAKTVFLTTTPQEMFNPEINVKDGNIVFKNIPAKYLPITKTNGIDRIYEYRDGDRNDNPSLFGAVAPVVRFSKGANVIKFASDYAANATPNDGWISFAELFDGITSFTNVDANGNRNIMIGPLNDGQYTVEITWATRRYDSDYKYSAPKDNNTCVEKQYKEKWIPWATKTDANYTYTRTDITISVADISSTDLLTNDVFNINGNNSIVFSGGYLSRNNNLQFFSNNDGETWYKFPTRTDIIVSGNAKNLEIRDITTRTHLVLSNTSFSGGIGSAVVGVLYPGNGSRVAHTFNSENQELEVHLQSGTNNSINLQQLVLMRNANFDVSRFEDSYHAAEDVLIGYSYYVCDKITRAYPVTCSDIAIAALNLHISGSGSLNIEGNGTGLISGTFDKTYWGSRDNFYYYPNINKTAYYSQYKSGILSIYELEKISDTDFIFESGPKVNISTTDDSIVATTVNILDAETTINNKLRAATLNYRMESIFTAFEKNRNSNNSNGVPSTIYGSAWGKIEGSYKDEHLGYSSANFEKVGYVYPGSDGKSVLVGENNQIHQYTNALRVNYSTYAYPWNVIISPSDKITFSFDEAYFDCQNRTSDSDIYSLNTPTNPTLKSATKEENYNFNGWYYAEMQSGIREYIQVYDSATNCVLDSSDPYYDILTDNGKPKAGIHYIAQYVSDDGKYVITYTMDLSKDRVTNFTPKDGSFSYVNKTLSLNGVIFDTDKGIGLVTGNGVDKIIVSGTNYVSVKGIYAGSYLEYEVGDNLAINNPALVTRDDQAKSINSTYGNATYDINDTYYSSDKCRKVVDTNNYNYLRSRNTINDSYDSRFYIWGSVTSNYDKSYYLGRYTGIDSTFGIFINGNRTIVITGTDQDTLNVAVNGSSKNSARGIGGSNISEGFKYIHIQHDFKGDQRDNHGDGGDHNQIGAIRYYIDNPANNSAIAQVNNINLIVDKVTAGYAVGIQNLELNNGNVEIKSIESNATEKFYDVIEKRYSCGDSEWTNAIYDYDTYKYRSLRKGEVGAIGIYEARLNSGNLTITNISATNSIPKYSYDGEQKGSNNVGESKYQELVYVRTDILKCTEEEHKEESNNHCYGKTYEHTIYELQTFKIGADTDSKASAFGYLTNKDAIVYVGDVVAFKATGADMPTDTTTRVYGIEFDANILKSDIGKVEFKSVSINNGHAFGIGGNATIEGNPNNIVFNGGISGSESAYAIVGNLTMTGTDCSLDFPSITSTNGPAVGVGGQANIQSGVVTFTSIVGNTEAYGIRGYFVPSYDHTKNPPTTYISGGSVEFKNIYSSSTTGTSVGIGGYSKISGGNTIFDSIVSNNKAIGMGAEARFVSGTIYFPLISATNIAYGVEGDADSAGGIAKFTLKDVPTIYGVGGNLISKDNVSSLPTGSGLFIEISNANSAIGVGKNTTNKGNIYLDINSTTSIYGFGTSTDNIFNTSNGTIVLTATSDNGNIVGISGSSTFGKDGKTYITIKTNGKAIAIDGGNSAKTSVAENAELYIDINGETEEVTAINSTVESAGTIYITATSQKVTATGITGYVTVTDKTLSAYVESGQAEAHSLYDRLCQLGGNVILFVSSTNKDVAGVEKGATISGTNGSLVIEANSLKNAYGIKGAADATGSLNIIISATSTGDSGEAIGIGGDVSADTIRVSTIAHTTATSIKGKLTIVGTGTNLIRAIAENAIGVGGGVDGLVCKGNIEIDVESSNGTSAIGINGNTIIEGTGKSSVIVSSTNESIGIKGSVTANSDNLTIVAIAEKKAIGIDGELISSNADGGGLLLTATSKNAEAIGINGTATNVSFANIYVRADNGTATDIKGSLKIIGSGNSIIRSIAPAAYGVRGNLDTKGSVDLLISASDISATGVEGSTTITSGTSYITVISEKGSATGVAGVTKIEQGSRLTVDVQGDKEVYGLKSGLAGGSAGSGKLVVSATSKNTGDATAINGDVDTGSVDIYVSANSGTATDIAGNLTLTDNNESNRLVANGTIARAVTGNAMGLVNAFIDINPTNKNVNGNTVAIGGKASFISGTSIINVEGSGNVTGIADKAEIQENAIVYLTAKGVSNVYGFKNGLSGSGKFIVTATSSGTGDVTAINGDVETGSVDIYASAKNGTATDIVGNLTLTDNNASNRLQADGTIARAVTGNAMGLVNALININPSGDDQNGNTVAIGGKASFISGTSIINVQGSGNVTGITEKAEIQENAAVYLTAKGVSNVYGFNGGITGNGSFNVTATSSVMGDVMAINGDVETSSVRVYAKAANGSATGINGSITSTDGLVDIDVSANDTATDINGNASIIVSGRLETETELYYDDLILKAVSSEGAAYGIKNTATIDDQVNAKLEVRGYTTETAIDTLKIIGVAQDYSIGGIIKIKSNGGLVVRCLDATETLEKDISVLYFDNSKSGIKSDNTIKYLDKVSPSEINENVSIWHGISATNIYGQKNFETVIMLDPVFEPDSGRIKEYKVLTATEKWKDGYAFEGWYVESGSGATRTRVKVFNSDLTLCTGTNPRYYVEIDGKYYGRNGLEYIAKWKNSYDNFVINRTLDFTTQGTISDTNEGWSWDATSKTLTLNGFSIDTNNECALILPAGAIIKIVDDTISQIKVKDGFYTNGFEKDGIYSGVACAISATDVTIASEKNPINEKIKYNGKLVIEVGDSNNRTTTATGFSGNVTMQSALVEIDTTAPSSATAIIGDIKNDNSYEEDKSLSKLAIDSTKSRTDWLEFNDYVTYTNTSKTNTSSFSLYFIPQITITKQDTVPYYGDPTETNYHVTYTNYLKFASDCDVEWLVYESATDSDTNAIIYTPTNTTSTDHPFMPNGNIWTTYNTETQLLTIHTTSYTNAGKYFFRVVAHNGTRAGEYPINEVKSDICELFVHKTYIGYDLEVLTYNSEAQQPHWATPSNVKNGEELHLYISTTDLTDTNITSSCNVAYAEIIISSTDLESETNWWRNNYEFGGIKEEKPYTVYVDRFVTSTTWYLRPFDISTVSFTNVVLKKNTGTDKDKNPWQRTFSPTIKPEELVSYTNSDNKTDVTQEIDDVWVTFTDVVGDGEIHNMYWIPGYYSKLVTMTDGFDYDIESYTNIKNVVTITNSQTDESYGTATDDKYTLIIHGKNNYTGTNSATWNINRATRIAPIYAEEGYSYIYRNYMLISQTDKKGSSTDITVTDYNHAVITIINGYEAFVNKDIILTSTNNVTPTNAPKDYDEVKVTQESISGTNYYVFTYTIKERIYSGEVVETNRRNFIRYALTQNYWNSGYTAFTIPDRPSAKHSVSVTGSGKVTAWISGITQTNLREMKVAFDEEYVLFATPSDKNNEFVGWYKDGVFVTSTNTITLIGTDEASDYVAVFKNTKLTKTDIPVPSRYIFTSDTIIGLPTNTDDVYTQTDTYTLSGTLTATNVGVYKIVAKLKPGCIWEDGTTADKVIEWAIEKATQTDIEATETVVSNTDTISVSNANERIIEYRVPGSSIYLTTTDTNIPMNEYGYYYVRYAGDDNHYPSNELVFYKEPVVLPPKVIDVSSTTALLYSDTATNAGCEYRFYPIDKVPLTPTDTNIPTDGSISLSELVPGTTYVIYAVSTTDTGEILSEPTYFKVPSLNAKNGSLSIKVNYDSLDETDVEITIESGNAVVDYLTGTTISGDPYKCNSELPEGNYNIVAHAGNHTETKAVYVKPGETIEIVFTLRELVGKVSTIVKVATPDTPQVSVRGFDGVVTLDDISSALTTDTDIKYIFTVTKVPEAKAEGISDIRQKLGGKSIEYVLDIPVERIVDQKAENYGRNNAHVFEFAFEHTRRDGTSVIRYHSGETGGNAEVLREIRERPETVDAFVDGTFYQDGKYLYVYAKKYSSFAVVYTPYQPSSGHGGGGGNFWDLVCDRIMTAPENTDVIVQAQKYYQMPEYVLQTLATKKDVNLVIKWNGEDIIIPASEALNQEIIKEYFIFKNPEVIEPEPIVEPIIIPEPVIIPEPIVEPEPIIEPEPVVIEVKEICYVHWIILLITLYMAWVFYKKKTTHNHTIVVSGITFFVLICGHCVFDVIFFVIYDVVALTCLFKAHPEEIDPLKKPAITNTLSQYSYFGFEIKKYYVKFWKTWDEFLDWTSEIIEGFLGLIAEAIKYAAVWIYKKVQKMCFKAKKK